MTSFLHTVDWSMKLPQMFLASSALYNVILIFSLCDAKVNHFFQKKYVKSSCAFTILCNQLYQNQVLSQVFENADCLNLQRNPI